MVRALTLALNGAFFIASAHAELSLAPRTLDYNADGATLRHLEFSDNGKTVTYQAPRGWAYSGNSTQLTLRPPNMAQAEGTIAWVCLDRPAEFDDETMEKLTAEVLASVPEESTNVTLVSQEKNPLLIARKETFLVIVSYTFYGENYQRSMMFLNRGNEQVRFQFVSRAADFKRCQTAFQRSHFTWRNL
jgi:hypothetical protein